jgi:hypothetical protein
MRRVILAFDQWMIHRSKLIYFSDDPGCLLRLEVQTAPRDLQFGDALIKKGEKLLGFHVWNEHLPPLPENGQDLGWALQTYRLFARSMPLLAEYIQNRSELAGLKILRGKTALLPSPEAGKKHPLQSLGFNLRPYYSPLGSFGNFWEHFYLHWLIWAFNPKSVKGRSLFKVNMTELWMTVPDFLALYTEE